ncbi:hypothetical protein Ciccas_002576 [Cichlidogyrus casuarinus]|uniref:von Willebrand factor n=1 Tax=Cichlidogyrus casuarinus TaxID=1844966 RepID=A0ABD2QGV7_9PLAT
MAHLVDDCVVGEWGPWTDCQGNCGTEEQNRSREVVQQPSGPNAIPCPALIETKKCQRVECTCEEPMHWDSCANACPYTCDHVRETSLNECIMDSDCKPGCRCPTDMLLEFGECVPAHQCSCYPPSEDQHSTTPVPIASSTETPVFTNKSSMMKPGEVIRIGCQECTCVAGNLVCNIMESCLTTTTTSEYQYGFKMAKAHLGNNMRFLSCIVRALSKIRRISSS